MTHLKHSLIVLLLTLVGLNVNAQGTFRIAAGKPSKLNVLGSSNVHDWTMTTTTVDSQGDFKLDANGLLTGLSTLTFSVNSKSLKSEHASMDERTYKTMKADRFPKVTYQLSNATVTTVSSGHYLIKAAGQLTIAGVTKPVTLSVNAVNNGGIITCTGSQPLKLTDYGIDPPTFMLGAMKVKNDLTIQFEINYESAHQ